MDAKKNRGGRPRKSPDKLLTQFSIRAGSSQLAKLNDLAILNQCSLSGAVCIAIDALHAAVTSEQLAAIQVIRAASKDA